MAGEVVVIDVSDHLGDEIDEHPFGDVAVDDYVLEGGADELMVGLQNFY